MKRSLVKHSPVNRKNMKNGGNQEKRKIDDSESDEEMDDEEEEATGLFYRVKRSGLWCLMKRKKPHVCFIGLRGQGYVV